MNLERTISWYLAHPEELMKMKPFTRGGKLVSHGYEGHEIESNQLVDVGVKALKLNPISQDRYITEYYPDMHTILYNQSIPHISVTIGGQTMPMEMFDMTQTASFQKLIHSAHVRNLTANLLEFSIYNQGEDESIQKAFAKIKQEWMSRDLEWNRYQAINTCKMVGNCAVLFSFDKQSGRYSVQNYSYEDGYQIVPNYDDYGREIATSLIYYLEDGKCVIDTYDDTHHYRITQTANGWSSPQTTTHGFSENPLCHKRGKVAWEYAESTIEMWELMANINAIALKRFGTFALAFWGDMDKNSFQRDSSTLIVNLSANTDNGKQDVKVLEFPEPQTMDKYLKTLEEKISLFSSTTFITPKDITSTGSGGNGIALAMSNDYALATQSALDWRQFCCKMVRLHQQGLDLEEHAGTSEYANLKIGASIVPWSLETNNTKITNLAVEAKYLSMQTILESMPDAKPDEVQRVIKERGSLLPNDSSAVSKQSETSGNLAVNRNNIIRDNE